jgi:transcription termination factor NusA
MINTKSEFALALNQIAAERGISSKEIVESIEVAIIAAYKKEYPEENIDNLKAIINSDTGEVKILKEDKDITPPGFGRIAAQTAKQVILQKIREAEKKTIISQYLSQVGNIIRGRIIRFDGRNVYVDIGKTEGILPKEEQVPNEKYQINQSMLFLIKEITNDKFNQSRIILSRVDPKLLINLFKREVPEVINNTVKIMRVVRQPGERAKVAVYTEQKGVDPVGACVGQKGIRVQTITDELGGQERIDIIQWNKDIKIFLINALAPAKINKVEVDEKTKKAKVYVTEDQAPLAIGKGGVNVNLASKLTDLTIDIIQEKNQNPSQNEEKKVESTPVN